MIIRRAAVVAVGIAACWSGPPAAPAGPAPTAKEILARVAAAYQGLASYADDGVTTERVTTAGHEARHTARFTTAFRRPAQFRFEYDADGDRTHALVIWSADGRARSSSYLKPSLVADDSRLEAPLADSTNADTVGAARVIAQLLTPASAGAPHLGELTTAHVDGVEPIDGHACFHLRAPDGSATVELWVDRDSYLLRRVRERVHVETARGVFDLDDSLDCHPRANPALAAADLAAPDTRGARVDRHHVPTWLGVVFDPGSARVRSVMTDGPAASAGVRANDMIVTVGGVSVGRAADVIGRLAALDPGQHVVVSVNRDGQALDIDVTLAERPDPAQISHGQLVDKPAPPFSMSTVGGAAAATPPGTIKLADLAGHVVVLDFWATWCGPCEAAIPELNKLAAAHPDVRLVGISDEELAAIQPYVASHHMAYTIARDDAHVSGDYMIQALPTTVLIDKRGIVREVAFGFGDYARLDALIQQLDAQP